MSEQPAELHGTPWVLSSVRLTDDDASCASVARAALPGRPPIL